MRLILFFRYSIFSYNLASAFLSIAKGLKNCSNFKGTTPEIILYDHGSNDHLPSGSFETNTKSNLQRKHIKCVHSSPIEWVADINPRHFDMRRNLFWRNNTEYSAYMVFMFSTSTLQDSVLFSCQPINTQDKCERHFLEVTPGRKAPTFLKTSVPSSRKFEELAEKLLSPIPPVGNKSSSECKMTLNLKEVNNNHLEYKWETRTGSKLKEFTKSTHQPSYFRGMYRHVKQERNCIKLLGRNEACVNCKRVDPDLDNTMLHSVTFYAKSDIDELVFKGAYTLSTDHNPNRKFLLDWDLNTRAVSRIEEMMYLEVPSVFYTNHPVTVNCSVSVLYFAYGTVIDVSDENNLSLISKKGHYEIYRDGRNIISKSITFSTGNCKENIQCSAPLLNVAQRISKFKTVSIQTSMAPNFEGSFTNEFETLHVEYGEIGRTLSCEVSGNPLPTTVEWIFPSKKIQNKVATKVNFGNNKTIKSEIVVTTLTSDFLGTYICVASNYFGTISKAFNIQLELPNETKASLSKGVKIGIGSAVGLMSLVFIAIVVLMYRKLIVQRQEYSIKTSEAIEDFLKGTNKRAVDYDKRKIQHHESIFEQPYNDAYEVALKKWNIEDKYLGQGVFGFVRKGSVEIDGNTVQVAAKMLKSSVEIEGFKSFLLELKIMAYIGHHPNIVSLVAACTQNIEQRDVMIGVEFCHNGSLKDYILKERDVYQALIHDNCGNKPDFDAEMRKNGNFTNTATLTELDLYIWSYQIANGMEFLDNKKVLHGDLATRNILLSFDKTAKISDFGLSRVLLDSSNYTKKSRVPLPWKWMAIESLKSMEFSSSSDVWAFGVTLWEIFSLGEAPYAGLHFSQDFIQQLDQGLRLANPIGTTDHIYSIMMKCWSNDPSERKLFSELKSAFGQILNNFNNP